MEKLEEVDISEEKVYQYSAKLLQALLMDRTTKKNIIWATDNYISFGESYAPEREIIPELVTGEHAKLIQPRVSKTDAERDSRTKEKAEVFTPSWVCNEQNNLIDEQWFGRGDVFNTVIEKSWLTNRSQIIFPKRGLKKWQMYVDAKRLEVSCGEAPYLVSRYDTVSGKLIPIMDRIGLLDRKLRVVNENAENNDEWIKWAFRAVQSIYGFELQGDNLLLARENILATFIDYYTDRFGYEPSEQLLLSVARFISWNIWQMDGIKCVVPYTCHTEIEEENTLFGPITHEFPCEGCRTGNVHAHNGIYCKVHDWRAKSTITFIKLMKGQQS